MRLRLRQTPHELIGTAARLVALNVSVCVETWIFAKRRKGSQLSDGWIKTVGMKKWRCGTALHYKYPASHPPTLGTPGLVVSSFLGTAT
jgi:hypothetical protein